MLSKTIKPRATKNSRRTDSGREPNDDMIDSYLHLGGPRFGSAAQAAAEIDSFQIDCANLVLPPSMPDFGELEAARERMGERVRLIGVPAGSQECERLELLEWEIGFGVAGLRLMPFEREPNLDGIEAFGQAGRWLFYINPWKPADQRFLLDWLERHPQGRIAVPHCLAAGDPANVVEDASLFREFLAHERVCVILSRHGGASSRPYPHEDLRPWVEAVIAAAGWDSVLWGSEYPVLYWRDEQIPKAADWLKELLGGLEPEHETAYLAGNAQRLFFDSPPPVVEEQAANAPAWTRQWVSGGGAASPVAKNLKLPAAVQQELMSQYLKIAPADRPPLSEFIADKIASGLEKS